ncbi:hypothetical protein [Poriferisphaera sp. WC338]|uniref:hypothetical protein n=1 Tax=Poriferisphaera sp. WC338 TaxID=3425129 RepID=UPI003D814B7A
MTIANTATTYTASLIGAGLLFAATGSSLSADEVYTFTSGLPPVGDGNIYPRHLNPARQSPGGGASPGTFVGNGSVLFKNISGNPAYFDSNNLLTRPSNLINGDAFWTDPKLGNFNYNGTPFSLAEMGFEFFLPGDDFGFDLAMASVSSNLAPALNFQVQDQDGFIAQGTLNFSADFSFDKQIFAEQAGTFHSLSSPRPAYEARFRISHDQLLQMVYDQNGFGDEEHENFDPTRDPFSGAAIQFFDIDLQTIANNGGTTQFAIDNFVYAGGVAPPPRAEPQYLPPLGPFGDNTPVYVVFASPEDPDPDVDGEIARFDRTELEGGETVVGTMVRDALDDLGARAVTTDTSIYTDSGEFGGPEDQSLYAHERVHTDHGPQNPPDEYILIDPSDPLYTAVYNKFKATNGELTTGDLDTPQIVQTTTRLGTNLDDAALNITRQTAAEQFELNEPTRMTVEEYERRIMIMTAFSQDNGGSSPSPIGESFDLQPLLELVEAIEPMFYLNYTPEEYLALKESLGEALVEGDKGSFVTPVFGNNGEIITYDVSTWYATTQSGYFIPIVTNVPEPTSILAATPLAYLATRRRKHN